ncbi:MAG: hypothetical protein U9O78_01415 [Patescibacteria group bacterium]|nr:hypothetical protein [Patescibacteria group bacterium]
MKKDSQPSTQTTALPRIIIDSQVWLFTVLLAGAIFLPSIIHQQAITGPLINAILLIATIVLTPSSALMIGLIPSVVALSRGLLPLPLAPMVPFIMLSNSVYIYFFNKFYKRSFILGVVVASSLKFALLHGVSQWVMPQLLPSKILTKASLMMSWPQLVTALAGGIIAWLVAGVVLDKIQTNTK